MNTTQNQSLVHKNIDVLPEHGIVLLHADRSKKETTDVMETILFVNAVSQDMVRIPVEENEKLLQQIAEQYNLDLALNLSRKIASFILLTYIQQN